MRLGALAKDETIVDLSRAHREFLSTKKSARAAGKYVKSLPSEMIAFLEAGEGAMRAARQSLEFVERRRKQGGEKTLIARRILILASKAKLAAPVPRPPKLIAVWVNYYEHEKEVAVDAPKKAPLFFTKFSTAVIGPGEAIVLPRISHKVDYEAELALVMGRRGKDIAPKNAYEHIAGYSIMNDVSARDFSLRELLGVAGPSDVQKSFDTFAPMGPYLVTRDEVPDPQSLGIRLRIGEELLQDSNTRFMIHKIPEIIAYISSIATLEPGDVITTGTPAGVGFTRTPPRWLRPGETVRIEIDRIGVLENPVVAEAR
jgi:acylpyruvate hydrolase